MMMNQTAEVLTVEIESNKVIEAAAPFTSLATMFAIPEELKREATLRLRKTVQLVSCVSSIATWRNSFVLYPN